MKKIFKELHLWLSVPFGLIVFISCITGAILEIEPMFDEPTHRDLFYVQDANGEALPIAQLAQTVNESLDGEEINGLTVFNDPSRSYQFGLAKGRRTAMCIDQYSGEILGKYERPKFYTETVAMHRRLMGDSKSLGRKIISYSTLALVIILISGLIVWLPKKAKHIGHMFAIHCSMGKKRFWLDMHSALGTYSLPLILLMCVTGLTWSFGWWRTGFFAVLGEEAPMRGSGGHGKKLDAENHQDVYLSWEQALKQIQSQDKNYSEISFSNGSAKAKLGGWGNWRAADIYKFDKQGNITKIEPYEDQSRVVKIRDWIYTLHVGKWGGLFSEILYLIVCLIGASLPLTGYYLWIKRLWHKK